MQMRWLDVSKPLTLYWHAKRLSARALSDLPNFDLHYKQSFITQFLETAQASSQKTRWLGKPVSTTECLLAKTLRVHRTPSPWRLNESVARVLILVGTIALLFRCGVTGALADVVISGLATTQPSTALKGLVLIEELNCAACHAKGTALAARSKTAPRLAQLGSRVNPHYLEAFIAAPQHIKPGTPMPDLLSSLPASEQREAAPALTHFLLSLQTNEFSLQPPDWVAAQHGQRLFHSRGCAQCHSPRDDQGRELLLDTSTPLGALETKYSFKSLVAFLKQPHASRPSGRMPDLKLVDRDVERIAHYLLKDTRVPGHLAYTLYRGQVWEGIGSETVTAERAGFVDDFSLSSLGGLQHHSAVEFDGWLNIPTPGRYTFFLTMNGGSLSVDGKELVRQNPSDGRGVKSLESSADLDSGWRRIQLTYYHTGHDPKFAFVFEGPTTQRGPIPSSMLSISNQPIPAFAPPTVDATLATRGRQLFGTLGCANCHDDLQVPAAGASALVGLNPTSSRGCLSEAAGPWPRFALSPEQRRCIATALPQAEQPQLDAQQRIDKTLITFNCIACHERDGLGGISSDRKSLFTGTQSAMGDQGRFPPPLTQVGSKLKPEWMADVLLHGKRQRDYLDASMPQFGAAQVGHLVELFGKVDALEVAPVPTQVELPASKAAGHELIGANGLGCIACHTFNGQKAGDLSALDIARAPERLKKNWFHLYLRQPGRFHPSVIMPSYWPDGHSVRPTILGGDTALQIEAIWNYLSDGERAKKPVGLSRQSNEIHVGDVPEICRGQSGIGYRGIAVGYPERVNLAFDSGEMALRQLWKGEFVNADNGSFHTRGTDHIALPPGIPFHRLESMEDNWPYKGKTNHAFPQDHGYQFLGYYLDAKRMPTFRYRYGDIVVSDFFEDAVDKDSRAFLKRTLSFDAKTAPKPFYFRVAAGKNVRSLSERRFRISALEVRLVSDHKALTREGNATELLIPLSLPEGRSTLTLEYQW